MTKLRFVRLAFLLLFSAPLATAQDRAALIALYESTDGDNWTDNSGWKAEPTSQDGFNDDPCSDPLWFGITCSGSDVTVVELEENQLTGTLPSDLSQLANLFQLSLARNELTGSIPPELGQLPNLQSLDLSINQLTGSIPTELAQLSNLEVLNLDINELSGPIPVDLGQLAELESLDLSVNFLEGSIPPELAQLENLFVLFLDTNELEGPIPTELTALPNLVSLGLSDNALSGTIPPELGNLETLRTLNLRFNQFEEGIPAELLNLPDLTILDLSFNGLSGSLPTGPAPALQTLNVSTNELDGPIPPELGQLPSLRTLNLRNNNFSGPIPADLGDVSSLRSLDLTGNRLTEPIPPQLGQLADLEILALSVNQLSGVIPSALGQLSKLRFLLLVQNELDGPIPAELSQLTNLIDNSIDLRFNSLYTDSNVLRAFLNSKQFGGDWESSQTLHLYFAQFADGEGLSSQITLLNLNDESEASISIELLDQQGEPLEEPLTGLPDGQSLNAFTVPASGVLNLRSEGEGDVQVGSVRVASDRHVVGVVTFGGAVGLAGVGASDLFEQGLRAPVRSNSAAGLRTGLALTDLSGGQNALMLELLDGDGQAVAQAVPDPLAGSGQTALFADEVDWDSEVDFSDFNGSLAVTGSGALTGTVLETIPGEFITLPVSKLTTPQNGQALILGQALAPRGEAPAQHVLNFAQFADGAGLSSALVLVNLDGEEQAAATIKLNDAEGNPLTADLAGQAVEGQIDIVVAAGGLRVLASDGEGDLAQGSAQVVSDRRLAGVIVFTGPGLGSAGVGAGEELPGGFQAPMESDTMLGINTGVALMNLESEDNVLQVRLFDAQGALAAETEITLPALGRDALFVNQFEWGQEVDFTEFEGSLRVRTSGRLAATVIQTRPGQFATQPVALKPAQ